ncbi:hypothetical protein E5676_scaffold371G00070 [Cucumis melo var. makuwa]|uniref:Ty3-gypsy retrotransposon protein n=1 Tax=Cucumis melo var. makuwa TaxID=1194695 RepID=A0A5D3BB85_CUCMM|nr:hypothetical protein E6C27_scaffold153G00100 [Cucumis melo var. makuwa]TYJ97102.1 hypothetical protein E5676_scaffold371G00070 [Cucumis melo var. makuwa]
MPPPQIFFSFSSVQSQLASQPPFQPSTERRCPQPRPLSIVDIGRNARVASIVHTLPVFCPRTVNCQRVIQTGHPIVRKHLYLRCSPSPCRVPGWPPAASTLTRASHPSILSLCCRVREVTLEFWGFTASAVGANSPLLGWTRVDVKLNKDFSKISAVPSDYSRHVYVNVDVRLVIPSDDAVISGSDPVRFLHHVCVIKVVIPKDTHARLEAWSGHAGAASGLKRVRGRNWWLRAARKRGSARGTVRGRASGARAGRDRGADAGRGPSTTRRWRLTAAAARRNGEAKLHMTVDVRERYGYGGAVRLRTALRRGWKSGYRLGWPVTVIR